MARRFRFEQLESRFMMHATPILSVGCYLANTAGQLDPMIPEAVISLSSRAGPVTGTVTAKLADPTGAVIDTETFNFAAQGVAYTHYATTPTVSGKYTWTVSYAGDAQNKPATKSASITITVPTPPPPPPPPPTTMPTGYQTFYQAAPDANAGQIQSTEFYARYDWNQIETAPGVYNFSVIDADYNAAKAAGERFNFGIMPFEDGNPGPTGLESLPGYQLSFGGNPTWQPNLDSPAVQADLDKLLAALGARYAANTATIDIGWYGPYGEWSNYNESPTPPLPSLSTWKWLIAEHQKYFPTSYVVTEAVVDYEWGTTGYLNAAMSAGCWQRINSWGQADSWDMQAGKAVLATMQASPYFTSICMVGEPFDTNNWSAADWQSAIDFAESARMAMFSTKGNAIPPSEMSLVDQLLSYEQGL